MTDGQQWLTLIGAWGATVLVVQVVVAILPRRIVSRMHGRLWR
jgi:hypothetical protein